MRPARFEYATHRFEVYCYYPLSYGRGRNG